MFLFLFLLNGSGRLALFLQLLILLEELFGAGSPLAFAENVFQVVGEVSLAASSGIADAYSDMAESVINGKFLTAFSFGHGGLFHVGAIKKVDDTVAFKTQNGGKGDFAADGKANKYQNPRIMITPVRGESVTGFQVGDAYGFEIADRLSFPKNFTYKLENGGHQSGSDGFYVVFEPDGNIDPVKISVTESNNEESKFKAFITVDEGKILVKRE